MAVGRPVRACSAKPGWLHHSRAAVIALAALLPMHAGAEDRPGPLGPEHGPLREQLWLVPSPGLEVWMRASVFRPRGEGPFPLAVISHGSNQVAEERADYKTPRFESVAGWLVRHGYAVVAPQRPGHGETGGTYREAINSCRFPTYREAAFGSASSIEATVLFMLAYPFVRKEAVLLLGHSTGAMASLALAAERPRMARAVVVFAGGDGGRADGLPNRNCAPDRLVALVGELGAAIRVPTLWLYAENDSFFGPDLSRRMAEAFRSAGGRAEYHLFPPIGEEGHFFVHSPQAVGVWAPVLEKFMAGIR